MRCQRFGFARVILSVLGYLRPRAVSHAEPDARQSRDDGM
jgi:hypothetical protein